MKKLLITGSEGFLASRLIPYYREQYDITAINRKQLDITNETQVFNFFKSHSFDLVFHSAAISDKCMCEKHPTLAHSVNTLGTLNIARGCALQNSTLLFASSDQIFNGNLEAGPYTENTLPLPQTVYAHSKLEAEKAIKSHLSTYYNLRLTWLFALPEPYKKINPNFLIQIQKALLTDTPLSLSHNEFRGMTYVYDVIENLDKLLSVPYGDYQFGSTNDYSTYDLAVKILESLDLSHRIPQVLLKDTKRFSEHKRDLRLSNLKLQNLGIFFPTTEEGILKCLGQWSLN